MKNSIPARYQLITIYNDLWSKTEWHDNAAALISAASVYLLDRDCEGVMIWDFEEKEFILKYWRNPLDKSNPL